MRAFVGFNGSLAGRFAWPKPSRQTHRGKA